MKIKQIASNMTILTLNNGIEVLFSYETPVAYCHELTNKFAYTNKYYSKTTNKHISKFKFLKLGCFNYFEVDQSILDELVK